MKRDQCEHFMFYAGSQPRARTCGQVSRNLEICDQKCGLLINFDGGEIQEKEEEASLESEQHCHHPIILYPSRSSLLFWDGA